ncbi:hypothetical protein ADIS_1434 [Lunatimonas lonarensis]|uniref:Uncharacterized protein n=1 Tax=Lunatimonas lonarensis TaxID=1232681 RepID=R7ZVX5_9BACT|nr:hypothetical protein ADIS_1434 [Lunatimonas lonarensis]
MISRKRIAQTLQTESSIGYKNLNRYDPVYCWSFMGII